MPPKAPVARHDARVTGRIPGSSDRYGGAVRVPELITVYFWIVKGLSTAMGEATSDYLVHRLHPVPAVGLGFIGFVGALALQFSMRRYLAWTYWFAVVMVGVFGTMAADVLHVGFGVSYFASTALYAVVLVAVFTTWQRTEGDLSIHSIVTPPGARRSTGPPWSPPSPWAPRWEISPPPPSTWAISSQWCSLPG